MILHKTEKREFLSMLLDTIKETERLQQRRFLCVRMMSNRVNRLTHSRFPHAGDLVLCEVAYYDGAITCYVAWSILCPKISHGPGDAGARYSDYGRELCNSVPTGVEVW